MWITPVCRLGLHNIIGCFMIKASSLILTDLWKTQFEKKKKKRWSARLNISQTTLEKKSLLNSIRELLDSPLSDSPLFSSLTQSVIFTNTYKLTDLFDFLSDIILPKCIYKSSYLLWDIYIYFLQRKKPLPRQTVLFCPPPPLPACEVQPPQQLCYQSAGSEL